MPRTVAEPAPPPLLFGLSERTIPLDGTASFLGFTGERLMIATGGGTVRAETLESSLWERSVHAGAVLCATVAANGGSLLTGGDDGTLRLTSPHGQSALLYDAARWIDTVACSPSRIAWTSGRKLFLGTLAGDGPDREIALGSTCRALAVSPDGKRLAVAQYGGVLIADMENLNAKPAMLQWAGAHLSVSWSLDGRFVVTGMLENALHVWKLGDEATHGQMTGYNIRPLSHAWTGDGKLATSGADCVVLWPFDGANGPVGRSPEVFGQSPAAIKSLARHPSGGVLALGYSDGAVALANLQSREIVLIRYPDRHAIGMMTFSDGGNLIAFASDAGWASIADLGNLAS